MEVKRKSTIFATTYIKEHFYDISNITLQFEDGLFSRLKKNADSIGYSFDNYVLYVLTSFSCNDLTLNKADSIDDLLSTMQFQGIHVPSSETGKGASAEIEYM